MHHATPGRDSPVDTFFRCRQTVKETPMRDVVLYFAGVPIIVIIGLHLLGLLR